MRKSIVKVMLLQISSDNAEHLEFLKKCDDDVIKEFGAICFQFFMQGINPKIFKAAAQKLEVEVNVVEKAVIGLMQLVSEVVRHKLTDKDFLESLITLGFSNAAAEILQKLFSDHSPEIQTLLVRDALSLPRYEDLEWRLNIKLATRSLHHQVTPAVLLKFHVIDGYTKRQKIVQTDSVNLLHLTRVLEDALDELKSNHVRRIIRTIS